MPPLLNSSSQVEANKTASELTKCIRDDQLILHCLRVVEEGTSLHAVPKEIRIQVTKIVKLVHIKFPQINSGSRQHERLIRQLVHRSSTEPEKRKVYTELETKQALLHGLTTSMSIVDVKDKCGLPKATFFRHRAAVVERLGLQDKSAGALKLFFHSADNRSIIADAIESLTLSAPGPKPMLDIIERDTLALKFDFRDQAGSGLNRSEVVQMCRDFLVCKATAIEEEEKESMGALKEAAMRSVEKQVRVDALRPVIAQILAAEGHVVHVGGGINGGADSHAGPHIYNTRSGGDMSDSDDEEGESLYDMDDDGDAISMHNGEEDEDY